jgi:hypothetical protein
MHEAKPLFRAEALRPRLAGFILPTAVADARGKLAHWATLLSTKRADSLKETELFAEFITDLFGSLLGYWYPPRAAATSKTCGPTRRASAWN